MKRGNLSSDNCKKEACAEIARSLQILIDPAARTCDANVGHLVCLWFEMRLTH